MPPVCPSCLCQSGRSYLVCCSCWAETSDLGCLMFHRCSDYWQALFVPKQIPRTAAGTRLLERDSSLSKSSSPGCQVLKSFDSPHTPEVALKTPSSTANPVLAYSLQNCSPGFRAP